MWYVIGVLVFLIIFLLISMGNLNCRVDEINNYARYCEAYIKAVMMENDYLSDYERRFKNERRENVRQLQEIHEIRSSLDREIRLNASFCDLKDKEVTIKEALEMLFSYLKLKIKPGDDVKIVKIK